MSKNRPILKSGWRPEFVYITAPAAPSEELQVLSNNLTRQINQALETIQQRIELLRNTPQTFIGTPSVVAGDYVVSLQDYVIVASSTGLLVVTLPDTAAAVSQVFVVKNAGSGVVKVVTETEFEGGDDELLLDSKDAAMLYSTGTEWLII